MKRPAIITIGIVCILAVFGIWVYLLLFGTPEESNEVFTNLGFDIANREPAIVTELPTEPVYTVDTVSSGLNQITTKPVAGYVATTISSSSVVLFAEQGTGHVYEINLDTGAETLRSRTTVPRTQEAYFSDDGSTVALVSIDGYIRDTYVGVIATTTQSINTATLPPNARNISFATNNAVQYTWVDNDQLRGYEQNITDNTVRELFTAPFQSAMVIWDDTQNYLYNNPADDLLGYIYPIDGGTYQPSIARGYGLVATKLGQYIAYSAQNEIGTVAELLDTESKEVYQSPVIIIPEKCAYDDVSNTLFCAAPAGNSLHINDWYAGTITSGDYLWLIQATNQAASIEVNLSEVSGRTIDVTNLSTTQDNIFFTNKIDNTLWQYNP